MVSIVPSVLDVLQRDETRWDDASVGGARSVVARCIPRDRLQLQRLANGTFSPARRLRRAVRLAVEHVRPRVLLLSSTSRSTGTRIRDGVSPQGDRGDRSDSGSSASIREMLGRLHDLHVVLRDPGGAVLATYDPQSFVNWDRSVWQQVPRPGELDAGTERLGLRCAGRCAVHRHPRMERDEHSRG